MMIEVSFADHMRAESRESEILRPNGSGDYLFLYFPVPMDFTGGGVHTVTKKHACVLLAPNDAHSFCGCPDFVNSFVHFTAPEEELEPFQLVTNKIFYPSCFETMNQITLEIKNELFTGGELYKEMIHSKMLALLVLIKRSLSDTAFDPLKEQMERFRYRLLSDCTKDVSVSKLAAELCMSRTALYKYYQKYFQSSPKRDILKIRMEKAAVLLSNQSRTVAAVAEEVGFNSVEHFTRYYKQYFGKTPRRSRADKTSI